MRNRYRFILGCGFLFHLSFPNEIHQSIRIFEPTFETINVIGSLGIPLDHITGKPGVFIDLTVKDLENNLRQVHLLFPTEECFQVLVNPYSNLL